MFDADAEIERVRIQDIAPTVLYALGLPVASDFLGEAKLELFSASFRRQRTLAVVPTWGERRIDGVDAESDESQLEQLRSLGYIE